MIAARYAEHVGRSFGQLTLVEVLNARVDHRVAGRFRCECGGTRDYPIDRVIAGRKRSCGCMQGHGAPVKHGMRATPEYSSWQAMKSRCLNPNAHDYPRYGGAGITVHQAWADSFEAFYAEMGPRPEGTTLDRIDGTLGYAPGNVRWATPQEQAENTRKSWTVEIDGMRHASVEGAAKANGVSTTTVVRWCDGYTDPRRSDHNTPPRPGCRRRRTHE